MTRQVRLYSCFVVLCAGVLGLPSDGRANAVQKSYSLGIQKTYASNDNRPVNERFPHAVLFGGTCGGTIISPNWILTAAHCTLFTSGRYVIAGTNNTDDNSGINIRVKKLYVHPKFTVGPYWLDAKRFGIKQVKASYDYMLAELDKPLPLNDVNIVAAKLPDASYVVPTNTRVGYAGYGALNHGETMRSEMHGMQLEVLSNKDCGELIEYDSKNMICARGYYPHFDSACNGDSGSGLVDENGVLLGIASWVENDAIECKQGAKVYFAKVAEARDWIREVTNV